MDDVHEPVLDSERDAAGLGGRIDEVFARALDQQLSEQRTLNRIVARVDEALASLEGRLSDLREELGGAARPLEVGFEAAHREIAALRERFEQRDAALRRELPGLLGQPLQELREGLLAGVTERVDAARAALASSEEALAEEGQRLASLREVLTGEALAVAERLTQVLEEAGAGQSHARTVLEHAAGGLREATETVTAQLAGLQAAVDAAGERLQRGLDDAGARLQDTVEQAGTTLRDDLGTLAGTTAAALRGDVQSLTEQVRRELAAETAAGVERLESVARACSERLAESSDEAASRQEASAAALAEAVGALRESVTSTGSALEGLRADVVSAGGQLQQGLDRTDAHLQDVVGQAAVALRGEIEALTAAVRDELVAEGRAGARKLEQAAAAFAERLTDAHDGAVGRLDDTLRRLDTLTGRLENGLSELAGLMGRLEGTERRVDEGLARTVAAGERHVAAAADAVRSELAEVTQEARDVRGQLTRASGRVEQLQSALLAYLAQRDLALEERRDALLREVLAELAADLSRRQRRRAVERLEEARRREREQAEAQHPLPAPLELEALAQAAPPPPPTVRQPDRVARTCPDCGYVAKTAADLGAHRRSHA